jgi:uncharacterized protein (DUF433 family)
LFKENSILRLDNRWAIIASEFLIVILHMDIRQLVTIDNEILGGQTVFKGTRVPVETLFDHLEAGIPLDQFLDDFPSVSKEQAVALLDWASKLLNTKNLDQLYEAVA